MDNYLFTFIVCISIAYLLTVALDYLFDTDRELKEHSNKALYLNEINTILNYTYLLASEYEEDHEVREEILDCIDDIDDLIIEDRIKII